MAKVGSGQSLPDNTQVAKEALLEVFQEMSSRDWKFLLVVADPIPLVIGTQVYDLPTLFRKPFDAYLTGLKQPLVHMRRSEIDILSGGSMPNGKPLSYNLFNAPTTGQIELMPPPDSVSDGPLQVRYYREFNLSPTDDDFLDIPARYEAMVLAKARALYLAMKGDETVKLPFWTERAEVLWRKAISDDLYSPDEALAFKPLASMPRVYNPNDTTMWTEPW